jgi:hypothetical protein
VSVSVAAVERALAAAEAAGPIRANASAAPARTVERSWARACVNAGTSSVA